MTPAAVALLPRGVRRADYLIEGYPVLHAIDSGGNCLRRVKMSPAVDEGCARAFLTGLLDHYDPVRPPLRLLPSGPPLPPRSWYLPRSRMRR
jgi:hypothetical protein